MHLNTIEFYYCFYFDFIARIRFVNGLKEIQPKEIELV